MINNRRRYGGKDNWLVCTYYGNDSEETKIIYYTNVTNYIRKIKIDGVALSVALSYLLSEGEHTVEILLKDRKTIKLRLFQEIQSIKDVIIPDCYVKIDNYSFNGSSLESVYLPLKLEEIGERSFLSTNLTTIEIKENVKKVGGSAFKETPLRDLYIYCSNVRFALGAFHSTSNLQSVYLYGTNNTFELNDFWHTPPCSIYIRSLHDYCTNNMGSGWSFPGVKNLFLNNVELTGTLIIPEGMTELNGNFRHSSFSEIIFPENFTKIGGYTFSHMQNLYNITIPETVNYIGENAFEDGMCVISFESETPPELGNRASKVFSQEEFIFVPSQSVLLYRDSMLSMSSKIFSKSDVKNVEYLGITSGAKWIDTGIKGNLNTEIGVTFYAENVDFPVMGSRSGDNNITIWCNSTQQSDLRFGAWSVKKGFVYGEKYTVSMNKDELIINGDSTQINYSTLFETVNNIKLYSVTKSNATRGRICSAYIKQNGLLILDLYAVSIEGTGYFRDSISGRFFRLNSNSSTFDEIGPEI